MVSTLGDYIRMRREALGIPTQLELARIADVAPTTVNRLETGDSKNTSADTRRRIARALRVRHLDLLIAAGELAADEVDPALLEPPPFAADDPRAKVIKLLRKMSDAEATRALAILTAMRDNPVP